MIQWAVIFIPQDKSDPQVYGPFSSTDDAYNMMIKEANSHMTGTFYVRELRSFPPIKETSGA
jgi:hypothetical protein